MKKQGVSLLSFLTSPFSFYIFPFNIMSILFPSPIFGPIKSRRLGTSLGINLMPADGKLCTFDCIYCECGLNANCRTQTKRPTREAVREALEVQLQQMLDKSEAPNVLTFAGNGEPTAHPDFEAIIDDTITLRDKYFPEAKVSVLSNATMLHRPQVVDALRKVDNNILKLDTVSNDYIHRVDCPAPSYDVARIIDQLCAFEGKLIIQTLFMKGTHNGHSVDNTGDAYVTPWLEALQRIHPEQVMIYTIDRATPVTGLEKATPDELNAIAERVKSMGFPVSVSY